MTKPSTIGLTSPVAPLASAGSTSSDPGTTGIPGSPPPTDVESALAALQAEIEAISPLEIDDEGTPLTTAATSIDFVGAGVTATAVGDAVTVTIDGGGGQSPTELLAGEIFTVPNRRQALWSDPITFAAGSGISLGTNSAFIEVH